MLTILKKNRDKEIKETLTNKEKFKDYNHEITIYETKEEINFDKVENCKKIKVIKSPVNLTRRINATQKLLKKQTAEEKLEEIKKAFYKE